MGLGGSALGLQMDVRNEEQIEAAVTACIAKFGRIDILINNASAISLTTTLAIKTKQFDLMQQVNGRGTFLLSKACLPHLLKSPNAHILTLSPPLNLAPKWFARHTAYTMSKYAMSMCTLGLAAEFEESQISINSLWPASVIQTDAIRMIPGIKKEQLRSTDIVADAALEILKQPSGIYDGQFLTDESVLEDAGITDFSHYSIVPGKKPLADLFLN